jgi:hypothetical protein
MPVLLCRVKLCLQIVFAETNPFEIVVMIFKHSFSLTSFDIYAPIFGSVFLCSLVLFQLLRVFV